MPGDNRKGNVRARAGKPWVDRTVRIPAVRWQHRLAHGFRVALCCAAMGVSVAAAQDAPAEPKLTIALSDSGKEIFSELVPAIAAASGLSAPPAVKVSTALGVIKDFCQGVGGTSPDIVLTTRRLRSSLVAECGKNGVEHIAGVMLGRSAMILAVRSDSGLSRLTARQAYLALARDVPDKSEFRRNAAIRWSDIDRDLPQQDIRFHIPPRGDSGRAAFNALILEGGCREEPMIKLIFSAEQRTARCATTRVDRVREIPQNQAVRALLEAPEGTVGVITYAELAQSGGKLVGIDVDGIAPDHDAIVQGSYGYTSTYYLYAKRGQALHGGSKAMDLAIDRVVASAVRDPMVGPDGLVAKLGLMPLPASDRTAQRAVFTAQPDAYGLGSLMGWLGYAASGLRGLANFGTSLAGSVEAEGATDFTGLMELAGYKTQEIQTSVSIIPSAGMTFGIVREMSEADQDYLERRLLQDARQRGGALAAVQRSIVRSVLDVSETAGYEISKVEIEFVPLPSVKLIMSPSDAPISMETTSILRAIERLNDRISELAH